MNHWLKRLGYVLGGIVALVVLTAAGVYGVSEARYRKQYAIAPQPLTIRSDSASVARGAHLVTSLGGCVDCHGENLAGKKMFDDPAIGRVYAMNLTRGKGGIGATMSDVDFVRAIRHGVAPDGRALKIMPSSDYMNFSDEDLAAVIAYVKSVPAVDNEQPATSVGPVGRALFVTGKMPLLHAERIDHGRLHLASVPASPTAEYGAYLASIGCKGCHGPALAGGKIIDGPPDWPPAANLTPAGPTKDYSEEQFRTALREGKRPDGTSLNTVMPVRVLKRLTDDEIRAIYLYLHALPATPPPGTQTGAR
ncbi:MAG: c-type cytochrome [bacterium]